MFNLGRKSCPRCGARITLRASELAMRAPRAHCRACGRSWVLHPFSISIPAQTCGVVGAAVIGHVAMSVAGWGVGKTAPWWGYCVVAAIAIAAGVAIALMVAYLMSMLRGR